MTAAHPNASQQAVVEAALVLLERMGLTPADLTAVPQQRPQVPTFADVRPGRVGGGERRDQAGIWLVLEPSRRPMGGPPP